MRPNPTHPSIQHELATNDLSRAVPDFLDEEERIKQIAPNTREAYRRDLENVLATLADGRPEVPASAWTKEGLRAAVLSLTKTAYSPRSVERMLSTWRQFSQYLMRLRVIGENPARDLVAPPFVIKPPVSIDRERVLAAIATLTELDERVLRDRAILELVCGCGLRVFELAELRMGDVRGEKLIVGSEAPRARARVLQLPPRVATALQQYIKAVHGPAPSGRGPLLLGLNRQQISQRTVQRAISLRLEQLVGGMRVTAESLRQAFLLWMLDEGADLDTVQKVAGHKRLASTQRYADHSPRRRGGRGAADDAGTVRG